MPKPRKGSKIMASYLEKECAILEKLKATGYAAFGGSREQAADFLLKQFDSLAGFADTTISQQYMQSIACDESGNPCGDGMAMDPQRKAGSAAASIDALNRLSADLGLEPFADVDTSDPQAVAGVVGDFIGELFRADTKGTKVRQ